MSWLKEKVEAGRVKQNSRTEVVFKWDGPKLDVTKLQATCGCSVPTFDPETGILTVKFKAGKIPVHLGSKANYTVTKKVYVFTAVGKTTLSFTATIVR